MADHLVDRSQTTSVHRKQATGFSTQTLSTPYPQITALRRRNKIQAKQRNVRGKHPLEGLYFRPPTIRRGERSREYAHR